MARLKNESVRLTQRPLSTIRRFLDDWLISWNSGNASDICYRQYLVVNLILYSFDVDEELLSG
jgi:hypothetical protein